MPYNWSSDLFNFTDDIVVKPGTIGSVHITDDRLVREEFYKEPLMIISDDVYGMIRGNRSMYARNL